ncbi:hypothetical protein OBBRIDRAFT_833730 [Obba rivulosa]|uniref:BTB domain-containing protein n=1 Tax=Obba rivulosa TaxID=1052685 RepID=A0A8E2AW46_9APHY|nr:hypothetical protein OBBRIDRAFT_833730 [Obba rivulosa]
MYPVAFVPRPFPPPALADVPLEYIIHQLRRLAPHYWSKPETSDCTIVIPLDSSPESSGRCIRPFSISAAPSDTPVWATTEPTRMVMKLHMDYLCAHSALLRGLLGGASPFDLLSALSGSRPRAPASAPPSKRVTPPPPLPCLLPSPPTRPTIYLPVPDPKSLRMLVHFIYFGATSYIEDALDAGELTWDGLARNVEYLGMGGEIRACLGRWYARSTARLRRPRTAEDGSSDTDVSSWESDDDSDDDLETASTAMTLVETESGSDAEQPMDVVHDVECPARVDPPRGRTRTQRRLGHSTSEPTFGRPHLDVPTAQGSCAARGHSEE